MAQQAPKPWEPASGGGSSELVEDRRDIFHAARACIGLFSQYTSSSPRSASQEEAHLQLQHFYVWESYLGVFAPFNSSLDKRLQYSDEIRSLFLQMLSVIQINLEFLTSTDPDASAYDKVTSISGLEGTPSEALEAIEASINRLKRIGAMIRKYSIPALDERINANKQRHEYENYTQLSKNIVRFKYKTATPSLRWRLASSMSTRRLRLIYLRRHQSKVERHTNTQPIGNIPQRSAQPLSPLPSIGEDTEGEEQIIQTPMEKGVASTTQTPVRSPTDGVRFGTDASKPVPTPSVIARLRRDRGPSIVSSSEISSTFMAEAPEDYPDPPKCLPNHAEPTCSYCCQPLKEHEMQGVAWARHVDKDLCPFICLSENCEEGPHDFQDFDTWAEHMRDAHTTEWPQLIHEPYIWVCDIDHNEEEFSEEDHFQEHLDSHHSDCTNAEKVAIAELYQKRRKRPRNTCPICGYHLSNRQNVVEEKQELDELAQLDLLAKHVAGHLRQLAFDSSKYFEDQTEATSQLSWATSEANVVDKNSEVYDPSGADLLDGLPLEFPSMGVSLDHGSQRSLNDYDEQWSPEEIEILMKFPEDLPTSAVQEWSQLQQELSESTDADLDTSAPDPIITQLLSQMENMHTSGSHPIDHKPHRVIPFPRNKDMTDRSPIFVQLEARLPSTYPTYKFHRAALFGPNGSGKTQVALEYAYRRCCDPTCSVFWVNAANKTTFTQDYMIIARKLGVREGLNSDVLLASVRDRIERNPPWLLVLDNADDPALFYPPKKRSPAVLNDEHGDSTGEMASLYLSLPSGRNGTVLWTSHSRNIINKLSCVRPVLIDISQMSRGEAIQLLGTSRNESISDEEADLAKVLLEELEFLPLAISQVGAYMRTTSTSIREYLDLLKRARDELRHLQATKPEWCAQYAPLSWKISIDQIRRDDEMAYKILNIIAYVNNKNIPLNIMMEAGLFGDRRPKATSWQENPVAKAVARLGEFAFLELHRDEEGTPSYKMHELVQEATRNQPYALEKQVYFSTAALQIVVMLFPKRGSKRWADCEEYVTHAVQVGELAEICGKEREVSELLTRVSDYFYDHRRWIERELVDKRIYELRKRVLGERHLHTIDSMASLAVTYRKQRRHSDSRRTADKVRTLWLEIFGDKHPSSLQAMYDQAMSWRRSQGRRDDAIGLMDHCFQLSHTVLGAEHLFTKRSGQAYRRWMADEDGPETEPSLC